MAYKYILILLVIAASVFARDVGAPKTRTLLASQRNKLGIYDGTATTIEKYPYMVSIVYLIDYLWCAGTILNEHWVLTTGWCVSDITYDIITVVSGSTDGFNGNKTFGVKNIVFHPDFNEKTMDYDFACLEIDGSFIWSDIVKSISLPKVQPKLNMMLNVSGWGAMTRGGPVPTTPMEGQMKWVSRSICKAYYNGTYAMTKRMACGYNKGKTTLCSGDQGDPFVKNGVIYGMFSFALQKKRFCNSNAGPLALSNVKTVTPWIKKTIK